MELFRNGAALLPCPSDPRPGVAFLIKAEAGHPDERRCTCSSARRETCPHIKELVETYRKILGSLGGDRTPEQDFRSGVWYRLAELLADDSLETPGSVRFEPIRSQEGPAFRVLDQRGGELLRYLSRGPDSSRFLERVRGGEKGDDVPNRAGLLALLAARTVTQEERILNERGFSSRRQAVEQSFWYRVGYHGWREFGNAQAGFRPAVEEATGLFTLACGRSGSAAAFRLVVPRRYVRALLQTLNHHLPDRPGLAIHPVPLRSIFHVSMNTALDLEVRPMVRLLQEQGEARYLDSQEVERFRYGDLVYIKELGVLAELEKPGRERRFKAPVRMVLQRSQIPGFLEEFGEELAAGEHVVEESVRGLKIFSRYDRVEVEPAALERDWCWLSVIYGFGDARVSLAEILRARQAGQRYVGVRGGWVDCQSEALSDLNRLGQEQEGGVGTDADRVRLSRLDLFRLRAITTRPVEGPRAKKGNDWVERILGLAPPGAPPQLTGLASPLRPYQERGVQWLWFLYGNGLGGLLCDDMGLGKTHQIMALMLLVRATKRPGRPFLVVCPTTVLSHWQEKIRKHAPDLSTALFHGTERHAEGNLDRADVVLTSYGVLRSDVERLLGRDFELVVFDEIQQIKNPETLSYRAAARLRAGVRIGLSGTPVENRLAELKALMDLAVPGYLGSDRAFTDRYVRGGNGERDAEARESLRRMIAPFTLRRLKKTVLPELPEKIEDIRTCRLSEQQVKMYRDALDAKGKGLAEALRSGRPKLPYMHIFSLLNLLKQICNHPALVSGAVESYDRHRSGKWDLFREILEETLAGGHKVVVYSQYLGMIRIIEMHLAGLGVDCAVLTGASRDRGEIVSRFNQDPACRAFVGSLKAGGTGIDLVAASVVIHYDRWWNAAREDQATDRVHRIGQNRGVQVFKLITRGTLEEKVSAIIERKRDLLESVVQEDDPGLLKTFSREELLELLGAPAGGDGEA